MIVDILAEDGFCEHIKTGLRIPGLNVAFDNVEGALGGGYPHIVDALFFDELVEALEESGLLGLVGGGWSLLLDFDSAHAALLPSQAL